MRTEADGPIGAKPERCQCPVCGMPARVGERFCEACGSGLAVVPIEAGEGRPTVPPEKVPRIEFDLGSAAAVSDRGRRRPRNEDAVSILVDNGRSVAVVCDGVASTVDAHRAAQVASRAALAVLRPLAEAARWPDHETLISTFGAAVLTAQAEVSSLVPGPYHLDLSPSTTLVAGLAGPGKVAVAGVGDSRAYWLTEAPERSRLLTVDDSWAQEQIAAGVDPGLAYDHPGAHTITRWIGAGAEMPGAGVTVIEVGEPGLLVLCSDGLWNYFEAPERLARQAARSGDRSAAGIARDLARAALRAGGQDNITVAVIPVEPQVSSTDDGPTTKEE